MKKLMTLLMALALVAAACGGDDDDASPFASGDDGSSSSDDGSSDDGSSDDGSSDDGSSDDGSSDDGGSFSGEGSGDWCSLAQQVEEESFLGNEDLNPFTGEVGDIEDLFQTTLDFADEAEDLAPPEIEGDVETLFDGLQQLDDALSEVDYNFLALDTAALESLDNPEFVQASENIQRYNFEVCGIGEDPSLDDGFGGDDGSVDDGDFDLPEDGGSFGDAISQSLVDSLGLTEEQASCLIDNIDLDSFDAENPDVSQLFGIFEECDIDIAQLGGQ